MAEEKTVDVKNNIHDHLIAEEKNKHSVFCSKCPSKILPSTMGKYINIEVIVYCYV